MRIFFCVELAGTVRDTLEEVARMVRARLSAPAKWVAKDNLHITVRFLGEVEEVMLPEIKALGAELARNAEMEARALGFPPERKEAKAHVTLARLKVLQDVTPALRLSLIHI